MCGATVIRAIVGHHPVAYDLSQLHRISLPRRWVAFQIQRRMDYRQKKMKMKIWSRRDSSGVIRPTDSGMGRGIPFELNICHTCTPIQKLHRGNLGFVHLLWGRLA
jgi:hypothetical protein